LASPPEWVDTHLDSAAEEIQGGEDKGVNAPWFETERALSQLILSLHLINSIYAERSEMLSKPLHD
jgi:hypothetical protein